MMSIYDSMGTDVTVDRELGWDDEIQKDSAGFITLPEGEYDFVVKEFERARFAGSEKMPPCNQAKLKLEVVTPQGTALINDSLLLHSRTEGMVSAFFVAIGQKKHGEKLKMNWAKVAGARGRAKIGIREYNSKTFNEVKRYLEPEAATQPAGATFKPGSF
jgi:hypothetical protein